MYCDGLYIIYLFRIVIKCGYKIWEVTDVIIF